MFGRLSTPRHRFSEVQWPQQEALHQNTILLPIHKASALVKVDDYDFFTPLMSRRCKVCKFLQIFYSNLKQDFSDYFKTAFFFPLTAISGTVMAAGGTIYLGALSGGFRPKLIIPTLLATQVVVPHGIIGGWAVGTTALTTGIAIKSLIRTINIVRMTPAERLLASCRNAFKTLKSLTHHEFLNCKALSATDAQRRSYLATFLEQRKSACLSVLSSKNAAIEEYQSLGLDKERSEPLLPVINETAV